MPRYKLTLSYDGTDYCGWQKQEPPASEHPDLVEASAAAGIQPGRVALPTVQHVVEQAIREVVREPVTTKGASRTDSGVHAGGRFADGAPGGQVCCFTSHPDESKGVGWPAERGTAALRRAMNGKLPRDVLVTRAEIVADDFDPISDAVSKEYTYTMVSGQTRPLWDRRYVFHTWHELDVGKMQTAAALMVGEHDFVAFAQANHGRKTTVRTIHACSVSERVDPEVDDASRVVIRVSGSGFLYNMVRIIAGTLMEVGRGRIAADAIPVILQSKDRTNAGPTLPPQGLQLRWIEYPETP